MQCARAGCDREATVRMGQSSVWNMLLPQGTESMMFCEHDATEMERVGGVRLEGRTDEDSRPT